jgi:hypothetical protein
VPECTRGISEDLAELQITKIVDLTEKNVRVEAAVCDGGQ